MSFNEGGFGIYQTLWPLYIAALGASPPEIGIVMGTMGIARLLGLLASGVASDRFSPHRLIPGARLLTALGMFFLAISQEWWHLIPAGIVMSIGNLAFPVMSSVIAETAGTGRNRIRAFRMIYTVGPSVMLLITPALGGIVAETISLRAVFFLATAMLVVAVGFFSTLTPRPVAVTDGPPVTFRATLAHRPVLFICLLQMATLFALTLGVTLVPNYLQEVHGVDTGVIGWFGSLAAFGGILIGLLISRSKVFQPPLMAIALACSAVAAGMALFLVVGSVWLFGLAFTLRGGYFVAWTLFAAALGDVSPDRFRARAFAMGETLGGVGFSVAPFLAGWLYDTDPTLPIFAGLMVTLPLVILLGWVSRSLHQPETAPVLVEEHA